MTHVITQVIDLLTTTGTTLTPRSAPVLMPAFDWDDLNPVRVLANLAGGVAASVWQENMTNIWAAGLWLTGLAFQLVDAFTSPELSESGAMSKVYPVTFGIAAGLVVILAFVQLGLAAWQRDGKGVGRLIFGFFQFGMAWGGSIGVAAALTVATAGLTQGLLQIAFGAPSFGKANIKLLDWDVRPGIDAATATVLGLCGLLLVFAAMGYLLVMLVRAAALMILAATSPIAAAGLVSESTRAWFWKCLRWFISAQMIAPLAALVMGIGKLLTDGVLSGAGDSTQSAVGQAVVGTVLVVIGAFCPLVLFRLLAFVDPGTGSGASFRASLDAAGGLSGLLKGRSSSEEGGDTGAATSKAGNGTSHGEAAASTATTNRVASALGGLAGPAGAALGPAVSGLQQAGSSAAQFGGDVLAAAGVGHPEPYLGNDRDDANDPGGSSGANGTNDPSGTSSNPAVPTTGKADPGVDDGSLTGPPPAPPAPAPPGGGASGGGGSGGGRKPPGSGGGGGGSGGSGGAGVSAGEAAAVAV